MTLDDMYRRPWTYEGGTLWADDGDAITDVEEPIVGEAIRDAVNATVENPHKYTIEGLSWYAYYASKFRVYPQDKLPVDIAEWISAQLQMVAFNCETGPRVRITVEVIE